MALNHKRRHSAVAADLFIQNAARSLLPRPCRPRVVHVTRDEEIDISPVESREGRLPAPPASSLLPADDSIRVDVRAAIASAEKELAREQQQQPQARPDSSDSGGEQEDAAAPTQTASLTNEQQDIVMQVANVIIDWVSLPHTQESCTAHKWDEAEIPANCTYYQCPGVWLD
jgi:hypothetical protein